MRGFEVAEGKLKKPTRPKVGLGFFSLAEGICFYISQITNMIFRKSRISSVLAKYVQMCTC